MSDKHSEQEAKVIELRLAAAHRAGAIEALDAFLEVCKQVGWIEDAESWYSRGWQSARDRAKGIRARYAEPEEEKKG